MKKINLSFRIGDILIDPPIILGGMGVRVSTAPLVAAVCNAGSLGFISSVGLGEEINRRITDPEEYITRSMEALRQQIQLTRSLTKRPFGVNIMHALTNFKDLVRVCVDERVAVLAVGAGLPVKLPELTEGSDIKLMPIVSSSRAAKILLRAWKTRFAKQPDAIVVEGPLAGGHLGFEKNELGSKENRLENIIQEVIALARSCSPKIPVIAAGGVYDGRDIAFYLKMGCAGVQMATRFVCTEECDVPLAYKQAYIRARKKDIVIIDSPVGLPGRVLRNKFVDQIGQNGPCDCTYQCLTTCKAADAKYCIAIALLRALEGDIENGLIMCGANVYKTDKIVKVVDLLGQLKKETCAALETEKCKV